MSLNPISTHKGIHILAVIVDISERKNAEKALRESERMAQGILDTAFNGFLQFDTNLKVIDLNKHTESIFGWDRENAIGQSILTIFANDQADDPSWLALFDYLGGEEREPLGIRFEIPARTKTGDEISVELSLTKYHRNNEVRFNTFIRDVTEQRAAEAHFRQAKKMEAIGQLTGGVAHDFNNILTVITGTIEILAEAVADRPRLLNITKLIDSAATRGAELTKHLLAFSRKQPLRPRDVDINALTTETARLLRPTLGEQLHVALHLSNDTWPALVDPSQLTTAILNLALNARDASPIGATLTIRTGNAFLDGSNMPAAADMSPGDYVLIEVADTGSGMDRATLSKAFEPFFTTKEVGKGTGLGLSMVYGFVKQSEGHVQITSAPDVGTSVTIYLPRAVRAETIEIPECDTIDIPRGTETILIVEDDDLVRTYVVAQIERLGYRALPATDAVEARVITESDVHIDLLFTDVVLRGPRNGRQIADEALKQRPGLKVLFTSGYTQDVFNGGALVDSDVLLLAKPYRLSELARAIRRSLET
ncbi:ATP-binding protein [Tardiphaga sp.]|uniref:hybrid sensor histidine kinase/response regulator n=1 Tax=Tardiphaga sp. TaxID=1926292 RepID=UPI003450BB13